MERDFGRNFGSVRIITGPIADAATRSVGAKAFTVGETIAFRGNAYAPDTTAGRKLLAHELAHVVQQRSRRSRLQRNDDEEPEGAPFPFSVQIDRRLSEEELLVEFVRQYRGVDASRAREIIQEEGWHFTGEGPRAITEEDLQRGFRIVMVRDPRLPATGEEEQRRRRRQYGSLPAGERRAITRETNRQFWERTGYRPGQQLGSSPMDRAMADYWMRLRDELVRQREALRELPPEIREFIFGETGRRVEPGDYADVLRIAGKLQELTEAERQAYLERTTARTEDLETFEASLDRYRDELRRKRAATLQREEAKTALFGLDDVYEQYRAYLSMQRNASLAGGLAGSGFSSGGAESAGTAMAMQLELADMRRELTEALQRHGYESIGAFESAIEAFEEAFRDEAVMVGHEMLDRYEHLLMTQEERYGRAREQRALHRQLAPARRRFEEAHRIRREHASMVAMTPGQAEEQIHWSARFREERAAGRSEVAALSEEHPLLGQGDFPAEELATAEEGDAHEVMLGFVRDRREDVRETRRNLEENPDLVWELDNLLEQAIRRADIRPDSIYRKIIRDHVQDEQIARAIVNAAIAVFAIAAGLLTGGTGTVAVLGATAAFGVGAYQAWEEFRRYEIQSAAHGAQLLSDDPSLAWVVVAVVGAGLDLAAVGPALRAMRPALRTFNETGDVARLNRQLARLGEVDDALRANVVRAARAEAEARQAWRAARGRFYGRAAAYIDPVVTPLAHLAVNFAYPVYLSLRRGIISLERFLLTREATSILGNFRRLSPEGLAKVRTAYQRAVRDAQRLASHGHSIGMLDSEIEHFLMMWNRHPDLTADDMIRQMDQWAEPLRAREGARARVAPEMVLDPASRARLPEFEHQIAGTGGIERITVTDAASEGRRSVTIEGEILPQRLTRRAEQVTPTRRRAPDFNRSGQLFSRSEAGLGQDWQRLHLWGPGFGDEAAAGMMWGPTSVNQAWQNQGIEAYVRELAELSRRHGGRTRVRATAVSWENPTPGGWSAPQGEHFLKQVEYEVTLLRPGESPQTIRVTLETTEPPSSGIRSVSFDPPNAVNLGDLF